MIRTSARILLGFAALLLLAGGLLHAYAFPGAQAALAKAALPAFYAGSFRALWLIDSASLVILAGLFAAIALRPEVGTRPVLVFLALLPAATACLIYWFVGPFLPAHVFVVAAAAVLGAAARWRRS